MPPGRWGFASAGSCTSRIATTQSVPDRPSLPDRPVCFGLISRISAVLLPFFPQPLLGAVPARRLGPTLAGGIFCRSLEWQVMRTLRSVFTSLWSVLAIAVLSAHAYAAPSERLAIVRFDVEGNVPPALRQALAN